MTWCVPGGCLLPSLTLRGSVVYHLDLHLTMHSDFLQDSLVVLSLGCHGLGLNNGSLVLHRLEAGSPRSRCPQGWFLLRRFSSTYTWPPSHRVRTNSSLCVCASLVSTRQIGVGPTLTASACECF